MKTKHILFLIFTIVVLSSVVYFFISNQSTSDNSSQINYTGDLFVTKPEEFTFDRYAYFEFQPEIVDTECSLNGSEFTECKNSVFYPELEEGQQTIVVRDLASSSESSYDWEIKDIFESGTEDLIKAGQQPEKAEPRSWRGIIRINCDFSHSSYNDPIVFPGQENAAHFHSFYGNTLIDHNTTLESLVRTGESTCQGNELNRSAYWVPALLAPDYDLQGNRKIDSKGEPAWEVVPAVVGTNEEAHEVFYYSAGVDDLESIQPIPVGLRMIAGDTKATINNPQDTSIVRWHCQSWESSDANNPRWSTTIPDCKAPDRVRMDIFFPSCWDGINLDSKDHKSHMAYPIKDSQLNKTVCPDSHPVPIVRPTYHYAFGVLPEVFDPETRSSKGWRLASDDYTVGGTNAGGASLHGDWFNAWHPTIMEAMLETCIQGGFDCHNGNLANGWRLTEAREGAQIEPEIINDGRGYHVKN